MRGGSPWVPPVFARVTRSDGREELAVVPSLGSEGPHTVGGWSPFLLVDLEVKADQQGLAHVFGRMGVWLR